MKRLLLLSLCLHTLLLTAQNPIIQHIFTADPAAMVVGDSVYLYTGHDEATPTGTGYVMNDWHVFSSGDMVNWTDHGEVLSINTFSWAVSNAWASHVVERNGMYYWYVTVSPNTNGPFAIGVAVSSSPTGPFTDPVGGPLITGDMTPDMDYDIDPAVFIDDDDQAYLYWGNGGVCKAIKLKANMTELDGSIIDITPPNFTEAAYLHKRNNTYYFTYAANWPETIEYSTGPGPLGPFTHQGTLNGRVSSTTNHQSVIEFKGQYYFIYHTADLPGGGDYRRSVCVDYLFYRPDGTIREIVQTREGVIHADSTLLCPPVPVDFTMSINGGADQAIRRTSLREGDSVRLSPVVTGTGTWAWKGPNGLTHTGQELSLTNLHPDQSGAYQVTFTNGCGTDSYMRFDLTINYGLPANIADEGMYTIRPINRSDLVSVPSGSNSNGANVAVANDQNAAWQRFKLDLEEDVYWRISAHHAPTRGLDVNAFSQDDGANVQLWDYWGGTTQQWQIVPVTDSSYNLVARHSGKCLAFHSLSKNVYQWTCNGSAIQEFVIDTVTQFATAIDLPGMGEKLNIRVYPVPASSGALTVDLSEIDGPVSFSILNELGQAVFANESETGRKFDLNLSLPSGTYFLEVRTANQQDRRTIVLR